jgi:hypothetical protein
MVDDEPFTVFLEASYCKTKDGVTVARQLRGMIKMTVGPGESEHHARIGQVGAGLVVRVDTAVVPLNADANWPVPRLPRVIVPGVASDPLGKREVREASHPLEGSVGVAHSLCGDERGMLTHRGDRVRNFDETDDRSVFADRRIIADRGPFRTEG